MKKEKLLLIGSEGFLGKNIKKVFFEEKYKNIYDLIEISGKSQVDITNINALDEFIKKNNITHIINSAAYVGGISFGYSNPADLLSINLNMAYNLYYVSYINKVRILINPISNCAYPKTITQYEEKYFWDGPPHESVFNYGLAKRAFVALGKAYFDQYNFSSVNVVLSNMYGPNDHFEEARSHALGALIAKINQAKNNNLNYINIWGDGSPVREWLFVEDGARALLQSLVLSDGSYFFNVGVNKGISINELAEIISECFGWKGEFIYDTSKPNGVPKKTVLDSNSKKLIGWDAKMNLVAGISKTVDWYKESLNEH